LRFYPESAVERTVKIQEVILRAMATKITWGQAAEIYQEFGYERQACGRIGPKVEKRS